MKTIFWKKQEGLCIPVDKSTQEHIEKLIVKSEKLLKLNTFNLTKENNIDTHFDGISGENKDFILNPFTNKLESLPVFGKDSKPKNTKVEKVNNRIRNLMVAVEV